MSEKKTYPEKLKHPKWQKRRLQIMELDMFKCRHCCSKDTMLNVHHLYYLPGADPWEYDDNALITLCEDCHKKVRSIKWQKAFFDLNLSEFELLDIAIMIQFRKHKHDILTEDVHKKYKCRTLDTMYLDFFTTVEDMDEYYHSFIKHRDKYING